MSNTSLPGSGPTSMRLDPGTSRPRRRGRGRRDGTAPRTPLPPGAPPRRRAPPTTPRRGTRAAPLRARPPWTCRHGRAVPAVWVSHRERTARSARARSRDRPCIQPQASMTRRVACGSSPNGARGGSASRRSTRCRSGGSVVSRQGGGRLAERPGDVLGRRDEPSGDGGPRQRFGCGVAVAQHLGVRLRPLHDGEHLLPVVRGLVVRGLAAVLGVGDVEQHGDPVRRVRPHPVLPERRLLADGCAGERADGRDQLVGGRPQAQRGGTADLARPAARPDGGADERADRARR